MCSYPTNISIRPSCRELTFPPPAPNREHKDSEPGRVPSPPIRISLDEGSHTHSYDFLGMAGGSNNNFNCPLPFESDQVCQWSIFSKEAVMYFNRYI